MRDESERRNKRWTRREKCRPGRRHRLADGTRGLLVVRAGFDMRQGRWRSIGAFNRRCDLKSRQTVDVGLDDKGLQEDGNDGQKRKQALMASAQARQR